MSFTIANKPDKSVALFISMTLQHCINCGVAFAMPADFDEELRKSHKIFHCPNGHQQHYTGKSEAEKLKEQLEKERQEKEHQLKCRERAENMYRKSEIERKKVRTRLRNVKTKIAAGVCPCCDQSFPDLHQHMTAAHPEFKDDKD